MEKVLALAGQHAHVVAIVKVDDANRTRLTANGIRYRVRFCGDRRRSSRWSGPWTHRGDVFVFVMGVLDPA